tara:strand:- start:117 stop:266 length:150 start_codon:yes stop_codon:yes gene_type:complete
MEDIIDYLFDKLNFGTDAEKDKAFEQLQAMGYLAEYDEPETWWLDTSAE